MMRKWLLFASLGVAFGAFAATTACSDDKVATPTSDRNIDDDGQTGQINDPGKKADGGKDAATFDSGPLDGTVNDALSEAAGDATDAAGDVVTDATSDAAVD